MFATFELFSRAIEKSQHYSESEKLSLKLSLWTRTIGSESGRQARTRLILVAKGVA